MLILFMIARARRPCHLRYIMAKAPLDYQSPYDRPIKKRRKPRAEHSLVPSRARLVYWIVMLTLIGLVLLYIRQKTVVQWDELMKPPHSGNP